MIGRGTFWPAKPSARAPPARADLAEVDAAILELERAAALAPGESRTRYNLGVALFRAERHDEACAAFRRAAALDPPSPSAVEALDGCPSP